jgi:O-antigen/teichoic acid export membrane protein
MLFFLPLSSIGIYDFALKCLIVIEFIMGGLHNSFFPKVVSTITDQSVKSTTPELNRYYHGLTAMIMLMISSGILILPVVIDFIDTKGYNEAVQYFPYIAVLYVLKSMRLYFVVPYGILKYTKPLPVFYFIVAVVKIGLMVLLIKRFEIYGVVASTIVSASIEILILKYGLKGRFDFKFNMYKIVIAPVVLLATVLLLEPFFAENFALELHAFYLTLTVVFLVWIYRNELKLFNFTKIFNSR